MSDMPPSYTGLPPEKETTAYKAAKWSVIILSVLVVAAVMALIVGGLSKLGKKPASTTTATFQLPPGARIISMDSQPGRLILRIRDPQGEEIDILDTENGHLVGQVKAGVAH